MSGLAADDEITLNNTIGLKTYTGYIITSTPVHKEHQGLGWPVHAFPGVLDVGEDRRTLGCYTGRRAVPVQVVRRHFFVHSETIRRRVA